MFCLEVGSIMHNLHKFEKAQLNHATALLLSTRIYGRLGCNNGYFS